MDVLSRRPELKQESDPNNKKGTLFPSERYVELDVIAADSRTSAFLDALTTNQEIMELINETGNGQTQYDDRCITVPDNNDIKRKLLQLYHDTPIAGHQGITGMYKLIGRMYTWPRMKEYIEAYIKGCTTCTKAKKKNTKEQGKMQPLPNPQMPWHWTESDLIGPLPRSKGKDAIYVVVDRFTKYVYFIPCNTTETVQSLANLHAKHVWAHKGLPTIHSFNRGPQFKVEYTKQLYKKLGIEHWLSTVYHPQSQGQVENLNRWLETYLRMFISHRQDNWSNHLHTAQFTWNNHYHNSIGTTPFFTSRIRHPQMTDIAPRTQDLKTREQHRKATNEMVSYMINKAQQAQKHAYDQWKGKAPLLQPGELVWLETTHLSTDQPSPKLDWKKIGPLKVTEQLGPVTYRVQLPLTYKIHDVFHVLLLTPVKPDIITRQLQVEPAPILVWQQGENTDKIVEEEHHIMEHYIDSRWALCNSTWIFQFRVKWDGTDETTAIKS